MIRNLTTAILFVHTTLFPVFSSATEQLPLSDPLTLEQALTHADEQHPDIGAAHAQIGQAQASLLQAQALTGINAYLDITAQSIQLSTTQEFENDSFARLVVSKPVYDFGRSAALKQSGSAYLSSREFLLTDARRQKQLEIIDTFYSVLLADMKYTVDHEDMVQLFLKFDKKRERHDLGMVSEVELRQAENLYLEALSRRTISEREQKSMRLLLAIALNRPFDLPGELVTPPLQEHSKKIPDGKALFDEALANNPTILSLRQEIQAAKANVEAQRALHHPRLTAEFEIADFERDTNNRGDMRAMLSINIPLYQGKQAQSKIEKARANLTMLSVRLKKAEQVLLKSVLSQIKQLHILHSDRRTALQRVEYRDLSLDHRRALYELELQTNMSGAQAKMTQANWLLEKNSFEIALVWARIRLLTGRQIHQPKGEAQ